MIIELLLDMLYGIFSLLTAPISIPQLPNTVQTYLTQFFDYLEMGAGILANYTHFGYIMSLFGIIIAVDIGIKLYHFVMWILKKIPMLSIS